MNFAGGHGGEVQAVERAGHAGQHRARSRRPSCLYLVTLMPTDSAAMRLSRVAMMARPERLLIEVEHHEERKEDQREAHREGGDACRCPSPPVGPLTSSSPGMLRAVEGKVQPPRVDGDVQAVDARFG